MEKQEVSEACTDDRHVDGTDSTALSPSSTATFSNSIHRNNFGHAAIAATKVNAYKEEARSFRLMMSLSLHFR